MDGTVVDYGRAVSPSAVKELDDFLRDIPSPTVNLFELLSQSLPDSAPSVEGNGVSLDTLSPSRQPSPVSSALCAPQTVETSVAPVVLECVQRTKPKRAAAGTAKKKRPAPKRRKANASDRLVLKFNGDDLIKYFTTSAKTEPQERKDRSDRTGSDQAQKIHDDRADVTDLDRTDIGASREENGRVSDGKASSSLKKMLTVTTQPDLENENDRLSEENERLREELQMLHYRNLDYYYEINVLRSRLYNESKLAPFFMAADDEGESTREMMDPMPTIRIPISAVLARQKQCDLESRQPSLLVKHSAKRVGTPSSVSTVASSTSDHDHNYDDSDSTGPKDGGSGVCLHMLDDVVCIAYCEECGRSAQRRAQNTADGCM